METCEAAELSFLYVGSTGEMEGTIVAGSGIAFASIQAGALRGRSILPLIFNLGKMFWGLAQSWALLGSFSPQIILATGGYACVPVVLAGWLRRIPRLLYLPDIEPGLAVRFLARFATRIAVTSDRAKASLPPEKTIETGYPTRPLLQGMNKVEARLRLGLDPEERTLLVWGGSRGAQSLNTHIGEATEELLPLCQIIHICGEGDEAWLREKRAQLSESHRARYLLAPYLHQDFPYALAAADLALCRAGASVLGELPMAGLPSILVPYPYAGGHQDTNADFMVEHGAALKVPERELETLLPILKGLLSDEALLREMADQARALARPQAAESIASLLLEIASKERQECKNPLPVL